MVQGHTYPMYKNPEEKSTGLKELWWWQGQFAWKLLLPNSISGGSRNNLHMEISITITSLANQSSKLHSTVEKVQVKCNLHWKPGIGILFWTALDQGIVL